MVRQISFFFFNDTATTEIYTLSLHDALPISELWLLLIVLGVNIFVAFYERGVGQQVKSPILIADAKHTMSDIWVTISVIAGLDRKSTRLNSSHANISYAVFCLKKKNSITSIA